MLAEARMARGSSPNVAFCRGALGAGRVVHPVDWNAAFAKWYQLDKQTGKRCEADVETPEETASKLKTAVKF